MGVLQQLPDLSALTGLASGAGGAIGTFSSRLGAFDAGQPGSPLSAVSDVLGGLSAKLDIDVSGVAVRFPQALATARNALPPGALEYVRSLGAAYSTAQDLVASGAIAHAVPQGKSLQEVALAAVDEVLIGFRARLTDLAKGLIPPGELAEIQAALAAFQALEGDFAAHAGDLLPFAARMVAGVEPDLLSGPLAHLRSSLAAFDHLEPAAISAALDAPRARAEAAFDALVASVGALSPEDAAAYVEVERKLDALAAAVEGLADALAGVYDGARAAVEAVPWNGLVAAYRAGLDAVVVPRGPSIDGLIGAIEEALGSLLASLGAQVDAAAVASRLEALADQVRDAYARSPLGQVQKTLLEHLNEVREAVEAIPAGQVQDAAKGMLLRVKEELDGLGLDQVAARIEGAFVELETFARTAIDDTLATRVRDAVAEVARQLDQLPIGDLLSQLAAAVEQLGGAIGQLETAVGEQLDALQEVVATLDGVSFAPVGDAVVGEIEELESRLRSINPDALSDLEKVAIQGALALLRGLDLEGEVVKELKKDFGAAAGNVRQLLDGVAASLERLARALDAYSPEALLAPLRDGLGTASAAVDRLNGEALVAPLRARVAELLETLDGLSPGRLLDGLRQPYAELRATVDALDPARWLAPLDAVYAQIDRLVTLVDIAPLLDELDARRRALLAGARDGLLSALDALHLPEPLASFLEALRPTLVGMTDALFGDPGAELQRIGAEVAARFKPGTVLAPLDALWDRLLALVEKIPHDALVTALEGLRVALGAGLSALDPERILAAFREGIGRLEVLSPAALLGAQLRLPVLRAAFEARVTGAPDGLQGDVARVSARFEATFAVLDPGAPAGRVGALARRHAELVDLLRRQVAALDFSGARASYARVRSGLDRLPRFLCSPRPLTFEDVDAALRELRPSTRGARLDALAAALVAQLGPMQQALAGATDRFFAALRGVASLVDPLALEAAVKDVYAALRAKVRVIDPGALAAAITADALEPLLAPLEAIDPGKLAARLDLAFQRARAALASAIDGLLAAVQAVLDEQLQAIKARLRALLAQVGGAAGASLQGVQEIVERVEKLVLVEVLDRLKRLVEKLQTSFDQELDRVVTAFDEMLAAMPGGSGASAAAGASAGGGS